jgi:flagellar hook-basal body complex protein FliE
MAPIVPLSPMLRGAGIAGVESPTGVNKAEGGDSVDFASALSDAIGNAGDSERAATQAADRFAAGDPDIGIHEVMIASEKASVSLRFATTVKNQALAAYRELMNTPI